MNKQLVKDFFRIGAMAAGGGPVILAIIYGILLMTGQISSLPASEVILGILTSTVIAFVSGGISIVWRIEKLPLLWASLLHASVLYLDYLVIYLINGWIPRTAQSVGLFTLIFAAGYLAVWLIVFANIRRMIERLNQKLKNA